MQFDQNLLVKETIVRSSRSGGSGGQNVNKVSTKVELVFALKQSAVFDEAQKLVLLEKLASRLDKDGNLHVVCQETRSQLLNKQIAFEKIFQLLAAALKVDPKRVATKVPKGVKAQRQIDKKIHSMKKMSRAKPRLA